MAFLEKIYNSSFFLGLSETTKVMIVDHIEDAYNNSSENFMDIGTTSEKYAKKSISHLWI